MNRQGVWGAPGRINLIGEHTDYSGGLVLPMALPQVCRVAASKRDDGQIIVRSAQRPHEGEISVPVGIEPGDLKGWAAYPVGVIWALAQAGAPIPGINLVLDSQVPIGAGLSSSAAVSCSVALAVNDLFNFRLNRLALAALARRSENELVGAPTGVMDQAASLLCRSDHLLLLDTSDMQMTHIPFDLAAHGLALLVIDTRTSHTLTDGHYGSCRESIEEGQRLLGISQLGWLGPTKLQVTMEKLDEAGADAKVCRRVRHVITENARVRQVADMLGDGADPRSIGPVLCAGHASLRDDFAVSTPQLDLAVDTAMHAGAYGARMTGGGFGGSAIALIDVSEQLKMITAIEAVFDAKGFPSPQCFTAMPSDGAMKCQTQLC